MIMYNYPSMKYYYVRCRVPLSLTKSGIIVFIKCNFDQFKMQNYVTQA